MTTQVLWVGHEVECYVLSGGDNFGNNLCSDAGYEREGVNVGRNSFACPVTSTPDWTATDEIWHRFNHNIQGGGHGNGSVYWAAQNAAGQNVAQVVVNASSQGQFQVWTGAAFTSIGAPFALLGAGQKERWDIHFKGGATGQVQIYYGAPGAQTKVLDTTGTWGGAVSMVRIYHGVSTGSSFEQAVAHEIVQTTSTLASTSEVKPPTSDGADTDGGAGTWANVDEANFNDSDTIVLAATGQHHSFKSAARTLTQQVVTGVTVSWRAWYEAGGASSVKPYLTIGGTRYYGSTIAMDLVAHGYQYTFPLNPATGVAFTPAEANAATLEWGLEAV